MEVAKQFAENLGRLRKRADISQEELGFRCSLNRTEIGLLEKGSRVPRIDTLIKLASGLGVRIDCALLDGIEWIPGAAHAGRFDVRSLREQEVLGRNPLRPQTEWWHEVSASLRDPSLDGAGLPFVSQGAREEGIAFLWVLTCRNSFGEPHQQLLSGLSGEDPEREQRFGRTVGHLDSAGLVQFSGSMVRPTDAAKRFDRILRTAHELRYARR